MIKNIITIVIRWIIVNEIEKDQVREEEVGRKTQEQLNCGPDWQSQFYILFTDTHTHSLSECGN